MTLISISNENLLLDYDRALYWPRKKTLFVTDLHLGKVGHFHLAGIPLPSQIVHEDFKRLDRLLSVYDVTTLVFLGDLFHSYWNKESSLFLNWYEKWSQVEMILIEGNHDRWVKKDYYQLNIQIEKTLTLDPFYCIHDWKQQPHPHLYSLSGHLHPAIKLKGKGRQQLKLPCFWFQERGAYLPAFGELTGTHLIYPKEEDRVFVVTNQSVSLVTNISML